MIHHSYAVVQPQSLSANQPFPHLLKYHPLPAGYLHLGHAQLVGRRLLGVAVEIPQDDQGAIPRIQLAQHLLERPGDR